MNIAEIRAATDKATPGPWTIDYDGSGNGTHDIRTEKVRIGGIYLDKNAAFIAASRQWVPTLCDRVEELDNQHKCDVHNLAAMQATLNQQAKNCEKLLSEKDAEIAILRRALDLFITDTLNQLHELNNHGVINITKDATVEEEIKIYVQLAKKEAEK